MAVALTAGGLAWSANLYRAFGLNLYAPQVRAPVTGVSTARDAMMLAFDVVRVPPASPGFPTTSTSKPWRT